MISRGHEVTLATSRACLEHPLYLAMQRECEEQVSIELMPEKLGFDAGDGLLRQFGPAYLIQRELKQYRRLSSYFTALGADRQPDFVFVPYLDSCIHAIGALGSPFGQTPWGGIVMRTAFHFESVGVGRVSSRLDPLKKRLFYRALRDRHLRKMFTIDETLPAFLAKEVPALSNRIEFTPDPVELRGDGERLWARKLFGVSQGATVLLVYGGLTSRKGIGALLTAMCSPEFPESVELLLAGRQDEKVRELLASPDAVELQRAGRIRQVDRILDDEEEHMAFLASDIVWMGYEKHYMMSGVLLQAGAMSLPVIACDEGLIGYLTRRCELGVPVSVNDTSAVAGAMRRLVEAPAISRQLGENGRQVAERHDSRRFAQTILEGSVQHSGEVKA